MQHVAIATIIVISILTALIGDATAASCPLLRDRVARTPLVVGYYASWDGYGGFRPERIRADLLTHINYAFAGISAEGLAVLGDPCADAGECATTNRRDSNFAQLLRLKHRNPSVKMLVSIGGWKGSVWFSDVAASDEARRRFVRSAIALFLDGWPGLFDGFDLDWESPVAGGAPENHYRPDDRQNYTLLAAEFRRQLDERTSGGPDYHLLTIAGPAGPDQMANVDLAEMAKIADWINVMSYDYHVGGKLAHFNAPLFPVPRDPAPRLTVDSTIKAYLQAGIPSEKMALGLPFFGRGRAGVPESANGFLQSSSSPDSSAGSDEQIWGVGPLRYSEITRAEERGFRRFWQAEARVPWLYNSATHVWISHDDAQSLAEKVGYANRNCLAGVMIWNLGGDDGTLLEGIHHRLRDR